MFAVIARHFDLSSEHPRSVRIQAIEGGLRLLGESESAPILLEDVGLSERVTGEPRFVHLPDGGVCEVDDLSGLDNVLDQAQQKAGWRRRLSKHWHVAVLMFLLVGCLATIGYRTGLSSFNAEMVSRLPNHWVRVASEQTLSHVDRNWLQPSHLTAERQAELRNKFAALRAPAVGAPPYRLVFREGGQVGAKTFSLPSGDIVITDEMVQLAGSDAQILALLAYELGHVHQMDALKLAVRNTAVATTLASYLSDSTAGASALSVGLLQTSYSLESERLADQYAISMLQANAFPALVLPQGLMLQADHFFVAADNMPSLLAPSPFLQQRIAALSSDI